MWRPDGAAQSVCQNQVEVIVHCRRGATRTRSSPELWASGGADCGSTHTASSLFVEDHDVLAVGLDVEAQGARPVELDRADEGGEAVVPRARRRVDERAVGDARRRRGATCARPGRSIVDRQRRRSAGGTTGASRRTTGMASCRRSSTRDGSASRSGVELDVWRARPGHGQSAPSVGLERARAGPASTAAGRSCRGWRGAAARAGSWMRPPVVVEPAVAGCARPTGSSGSSPSSSR